MIFSMHCCLHLVGQAVSVGNVDRLLVDYYERDIKEGKLTPEDVCASVHLFVTAIWLLYCMLLDVFIASM